MLKGEVLEEMSKTHIPAPERAISCPRSKLKVYKNLLRNYGDFMKEFKLH